MNTARSITFAMLMALAGLFFALCAGCATVPAHAQLRREVSISGPTALVTGPATGHWAETNERPVMLYTVLGTDCEFLATQYDAPHYQAHGTFALAPGVTLCAIQLRDNQTVLLHAERP